MDNTKTERIKEILKLIEDNSTSGGQDKIKESVDKTNKEKIKQFLKNQGPYGWICPRYGR